MCRVLKRVFGYTQHAQSDKREFKERFSNMSTPMISRENARCAILLISSLLATLDMIPVLKKLPLKRVFGYVQHMQSVKESLKRVSATRGTHRVIKESLKRVFPICQPP